VKEAAAKYNQPPRKLLDALRKRFPAEEWTMDSPLPQNFEEMVEQYRQEYVQAEESGLPKGEITTTAEAVQDNALMLEAIEYGVLESLSQLRREDMAYRAKVDTLSEIQTYESVRAAVWQGYHQKQAQARGTRMQQMGEDLKNAMLTQNTALGKHQADLVVSNMETNLKQTERRMELDAIVRLVSVLPQDNPQEVTT
jgi:hypothetical protein